MGEKENFFSIIIPNYNSEKWIKKCLESILNQTYKKYEIMFIDDISTDNSLQIAIDTIGSKQPTTFIKNTTKRLNGGTRNVGIAEAIGDYIICIDCDDWLKDEKVLEDINNKLNGEDVMFLGYECLSKNNVFPMQLKYNNINEAIKDITCAIWTKVVKANLMKETPFPEGTLFEDRIQHYRLLMKCKTFTNLGRTTHIWNRLNENTTSERKDYVWYRFNYCGELYRLIQDIEDIEFKEYLKNELRDYLDSCNRMVEEI